MLHVHNEQNRLYLQFKNDLFEDLGIINNPTAEKLFEISWSYGHAHGYEAVYNYATGLLDLII